MVKAKVAKKKDKPESLVDLFLYICSAITDEGFNLQLKSDVFVEFSLLRS